MEVFVDIIGYEGRYKISNKGNIYSTPQDGKPNRILKFDDSSEYLRVSLSKFGKVKRFSVHRLVAEHFVTKSDSSKNMVNHLDNNTKNNYADNLEWATHSENMMYAQKQGRLFNSQSKAGKIASINKLKEITQSVLELKGTIINHWIVEGTLIRRKTKLLMKCQCSLCLNYYDVERYSLMSGTTKSCKKCAYTLIKRKE